MYVTVTSGLASLSALIRREFCGYHLSAVSRFSSKVVVGSVTLYKLSLFDFPAEGTYWRADPLLLDLSWLGPGWGSSTWSNLSAFSIDPSRLKVTRLELVAGVQLSLRLRWGLDSLSDYLGVSWVTVSEIVPVLVFIVWVVFIFVSATIDSVWDTTGGWRRGSVPGRAMYCSGHSTAHGKSLWVARGFWSYASSFMIFFTASSALAFFVTHLIKVFWNKHNLISFCERWELNHLRNTQ